MVFAIHYSVFAIHYTGTAVHIEVARAAVCSFREYEKSCKFGVLHVHEDSNICFYCVTIVLNLVFQQNALKLV